ncbi:abortive infection system antitoxin AbiGi family protein [Alistipes sp. ZOR0009]|uniref:abortive infection system antitoxin AbiGi family protein n=1 Tax=Alistipes sp. ZOR0009 TaxID=1339253 RepID=UPI000646FA63|nr:abortive infection system antitoxin AbiGi family protein [Alistipes sp. ZOR0009]
MSKIAENLSAETLFHFTSSIDHLVNILKTNFSPRYCLEDSSYFSIKGYSNTEQAYPMVCFCDIPLSKIKSHLITYGEYGIGLSKDWGFKNNLTPLIYSRPNTKTSNAIENLITWYLNNNELKDSDDIKLITSELLMHIKPYEGKMYRNGKYELTKFYDEREWRWIPNIANDEIPLSIDKKTFNDSKTRDIYNEKICNYYSLKFTPQDIKYLIIKDDSEISSFIEKIESIKGFYDSKTIKILTTRIFTSNQIKFDL